VEQFLEVFNAPSSLPAQLPGECSTWNIPKRNPIVEREICHSGVPRGTICVAQGFIPQRFFRPACEYLPGCIYF